MEKYSRVLITIFLLVVINLVLSFYILTKLNQPVKNKEVQPAVVAKIATPSATVATPISTPNIQSDLTLIKAEIRAMRTSLETTGLIVATPEP